MKRHISILGEQIWHYFLDLEDFQKYWRFVKKRSNIIWRLGREDTQTVVVTSYGKEGGFGWKHQISSYGGGV